MYKRFLHAKEDDELKKLGKEILTNQFKNEKIRFSERNLKNILDSFKFKNVDELFLKSVEASYHHLKLSFHYFLKERL